MKELIAPLLFFYSIGLSLEVSAKGTPPHFTLPPLPYEKSALASLLFRKNPYLPLWKTPSKLCGDFKYACPRKKAHFLFP